MSFWTSAVYGETIYVSPVGNDANPGTLQKPMKTLEAARDNVRSLSSKGGHKILLRGGTYRIRKPFELSKADSGIKGHPNIYTAYNDEKVYLIGAVDIAPHSFKPVTDASVIERLGPGAASKILQADLKAAGAEIFDSSNPRVTPPELFFNDTAMHIARWPNTGYLRTGKIIHPGSILRYWKVDMQHRKEYIPPEKRENPPIGGVFVYENDRPSRWKKASDIKMFGYWKFDWSDETVTIKNIDTNKKQIETVQPHQYGYHPNRRYYVFDLLEELDVPGEYFIDKTSSTLYFYPPEPITEESNIRFSQLDSNMITGKDISNVIFKNLNLQTTRGGFFNISGSSNLIAACTMQNSGSNAARISGTKNGIVACDISHTNSGIALYGGDRKTLTPAGNYANNNHIYHFSRFDKTYRNAISLNGVGNIASNNRIHNAVHGAISFYGNDNQILYNEIYDICQKSDDAAALYAGRNATLRGNLIKGNFIHSIKGIHGGSVGVSCIYLDDLFCGTIMTENIFYNAPIGLFLNGGRDNILTNNIFIDVDKSVRLSDWGLHRTPYSGYNPDSHCYGTKLNPSSFKKVPIVYNKPPYTKYPNLANILEDEPRWPKYNRIECNLLYRSGLPYLHIMNSIPGNREKIKKDNTLQNNIVVDDDPGFTDLKHLNLTAREPSAISKIVPEFTDIPFEKIGLKIDKYRKTLPLKSPIIDPAGGTFFRKVKVYLRPTFSGVNNEKLTVHYTIDGSQPNRNSPVCDSFITLDHSATVKVVVFPHAEDSPLQPSFISTADFHVETEPYLSNMVSLEHHAHGNLKRDINYKGNARVSLQGVTYKKSLMTCPVAETKIGYVIYDLAGLSEYKTFKATIGIDDFVGDRGSCEFIVQGFKDGDYRQLFKSLIMKGKTPAQSISIDITGCTRLKLIATNGRDHTYSDHAVWADVRLE